MFVFNCLGSITSSLVRLLRLQLSQTCDMERLDMFHQHPSHTLGGEGGGGLTAGGVAHLSRLTGKATPP